MSAGTGDGAPAVTARKLCRSFRLSGGVTVAAVRDVDFTIPTGAFVAILGPSGSGKSSLLNLLGCIDTPTSGEVEVLGRRVTGGAVGLAQFRLRHLGFVFQRFNLIDYLTAAENVALPLFYARPRPSSRERVRRAEEMLELVGLSARASHRPDQLSGGEQQRVGVARALVGSPDILFADEPTGELDTATGAEIVRMLVAARQQRGTTLVVVTHDSQVASQADREIHMVDGRVEG